MESNNWFSTLFDSWRRQKYSLLMFHQLLEQILCLLNMENNSAESVSNDRIKPSNAKRPMKSELYPNSPLISLGSRKRLHALPIIVAVRAEF